MSVGSNAAAEVALTAREPSPLAGRSHDNGACNRCATFSRLASVFGTRWKRRPPMKRGRYNRLPLNRSRAAALVLRWYHEMDVMSIPPALQAINAQ